MTIDEKIQKIDDFINSLYDMRQNSITRDGEFGIGNLVFKECRALGYLDTLREYKKQLSDKKLSLENINEKEYISVDPFK